MSIVIKPTTVAEYKALTLAEWRVLIREWAERHPRIKGYGEAEKTAWVEWLSNERLKQWAAHEDGDR